MIDLTQQELTELCFIADAIVAVPSATHEIIAFSIQNVPKNSSLIDALHVIELALSKVSVLTSVEPLLQALNKSRSKTARTVADILTWAYLCRRSKRS
jgi:hypothetical protein